jgi:hypothetical protein
MRKGNGKEALLSHSGHVLMENRHGLILGADVDAADGRAERRAAKRLLTHVGRRHGLAPETAGLDAGYDDGRFLDELESAFTSPCPGRDAGGGAPGSRLAPRSPAGHG